MESGGYLRIHLVKVEEHGAGGRALRLDRRADLGDGRGTCAVVPGSKGRCLNGAPLIKRKTT